MSTSAGCGRIVQRGIRARPPPAATASAATANSLMRWARRSRRPAAVAMASMVATTGKPSCAVIQGSSATSRGVSRRLTASGWSAGIATSSGSRRRVVAVTVRGQPGVCSRRWASTRSYSLVSGGKSSCVTSASARDSCGPPGSASAWSSSGKNAEAALWKAATDTSPSGRSTNSATVCRARSSAVSTSIAAPASACPASVSTSRRPWRSVSGTGIARWSSRSCWEIAEGVTSSASATAVTLPSSPSSRRILSCRSSMSSSQSIASSRCRDAKGSFKKLALGFRDVDGAG